LGDGTTATPWDVARGPAGDRAALFVALHTNAAPEDADPDPDASDNADGAEAAPAAAPAAYLRPTAVPTGGVRRLGLDPRTGRFAGRDAWAVAPQAGLLNRPSGLAFSRCGTRAYVATFLPQEEGGGGAPARGVRAFWLGAASGAGGASSGGSGGAARAARARRGGGGWALLRGWDAAAAAAAGVHPWGVAVHPATGALLVTAHGGEAGHVIAELCGATGALRALWRHASLEGAAPNALALL
jgi:hypothetical protein